MKCCLGLAVAAMLVGCTQNQTKPQAPLPGRVDKVVAKKQPSVSAAEFCDVHYASSKRPTLKVPKLDKALPAPKSWRWVNLWATWCEPCVEEIPLLVRFQSQLNSPKQPLELIFVSVDEDPKAMAAYTKKQPAVGKSLRITDTSDEVLSPWFESLGLDKLAGVPIHIFTDTKGGVACARAGAVALHHKDAIKEVLGGS